MSKGKRVREIFEAVIMLNEEARPYARRNGKPLHLSRRMWSKDDRIIVTVERLPAPRSKGGRK